MLARITYSHRSPRVSRTGKMPLLPFESMANLSVTQKRLKLFVTLPKVTKDVGEQLSTAHRAEKEKATEMLQLILSSVRYLSRQGLALRGDNDSANLTQLLCLREINLKCCSGLINTLTSIPHLKIRTKCLN